MDLPSALKQVDESVTPLYFMSQYDTETVGNALKQAGELVKQTCKWRTEVGDKLSESSFIDMVMKMKKWFNEAGIFRSDQMWTNVAYFLKLLWDSADSSLLFARKLIESDYLKYTVYDLKHPPYLELLRQSDERTAVLFSANISIMYNCSKVEDLKDKFYELNVGEALEPLTKVPNETIKIEATVALAEFLTEEQAGKMATTDDVINNLVTWLGKALVNAQRFCVFYPIEIIHGLWRLSVNDHNKKKIMATKPMPTFMNMLLNENFKDEQKFAVTTIGSLAFDAEVRAEFKANEELMSALNRFVMGENEKLAHVASSALWIINESSQDRIQDGQHQGGVHSCILRRSVSAGNFKGHLMITYSWGDQKTMLQVKNKLQACGYKVWMDVEQMAGSTLQAMADAIEGASLVIVCMSEKYKNSSNCRIEAEYAFQRQKPIVPLVLQRGYKPDGWLGIMIGSRLFVDFSGKYEFEKSWRNLDQQLKHTLKENLTVATEELATSAASATNGKSFEFLNWKQEDVARWLQELELDTSYVDKFRKIDGKGLEQLQTVLKTAPDSYYAILRDDLRMSFADLINFTTAVSNLN